jgi:hypothetical protein
MFRVTRAPDSDDLKSRLVGVRWDLIADVSSSELLTSASADPPATGHDKNAARSGSRPQR